MDTYALGLDFGTLSVRALFLNLQSGKVHVPAVYEYPHGVMRDALPDGTKLPDHFSLEHPSDFREGMIAVVREGMRRLRLQPEQVVGIGVDVTSSTVLPVDASGEPLCLKPEFSGRPQAWMKLWNHLGAQEYARRLMDVARQREEPWLSCYGGWISSELLIPKAVETALQDPQVFAATAQYVEAGDWIVWELTGQLTRSATLAGCNSLYRPETGYPSGAFFAQAYPQAAQLPQKLGGRMGRLGERAGGLTHRMAAEMGLRPGTPVGVATIDSHAGVIGCGAVHPGDMVSVIGTSACHMLNSVHGVGIPGIQSMAMDANVPGLYGYEGGQNCVGDALAWFVENSVPRAYYDAAAERKKEIHGFLSEKAAVLRPGESGLLALDWFRGVRAPLMDFSLTATIVGLTIRTRPEEIYRALLESLAFGALRIIHLYEDGGHPVNRIIAAGGIPEKNPLLMQIYADVCNRDIYLCATSQGCALGSAILGAAAAGQSHTGCENFADLAQKYVTLSETVYHPNAQNVPVYQLLYQQYLQLSDQMAQVNSVTRQLRDLRDRQIQS